MTDVVTVAAPTTTAVAASPATAAVTTASPSLTDPSNNVPAVVDPNLPAKVDEPAKADDDVGSLLLHKKPDDKGEKKEGDPDKKEGDPEKKDGDKPEELPPVTIADVVIPESMPIPEDIKGDFDTFAKDHKLTKEAAQAGVDLHIKMMNKLSENWNNVKKGWKTECVNDPEIGGTKLEATVSSVDNVISKFCKTEAEFLGMQEMLVQNGAGVNPNFLKVMTRIAAEFKDDTLVPPGGAVSTAVNDPAKRMWPNMPGDKK